MKIVNLAPHAIPKIVLTNLEQSTLSKSKGQISDISALKGLTKLKPYITLKLRT